LICRKACETRNTLVMHFIALTIFPELFRSFQEHGIVRRAVENRLVRLDTINPREFCSDRHRTIDDRPYGGGCGMVMKPEPLTLAVRKARLLAAEAPVVLLTPQGRVLNQAMAAGLAGKPGLIFVCGRYEGVDERVVLNEIDLEISVGDFVLTGGELPAMILMDAVTRLLPGALGGEDSAARDSFTDGLLEHAHFTRPPDFEGQSPPQVLFSGHHREIEDWRRESSLIRTFLKRRELLENRPLTSREVQILKKWHGELEQILRAQSKSGADPPSGGQSPR